MAEAKSKAETRNIEKQIEIAASAEAVWKALTDADELARWFPIEARVKPGVGGTVKLSWGPGGEGEAPITAWEPNRHFQWAAAIPGSGDGIPSRVDWVLESQGGRTLVRLVNSGFASGSDWENEIYDSTNYGWAFMLVNLRHYLERHAGEPRQVAWPRKKAAVTRAEAYARVAGANGLLTTTGPVQLQPGAIYSARTAWGETYSGRAEFVAPPRGFCVTVNELNEALLWLTIEGAPGKLEVQLWLSAYRLPQTRIEAFQNSANTLLDRLFQEPVASA